MPTARPVAVFFRHGHYVQPELVPSAHLPHPLTAEGRAQVIAGAEKLAEFCAAHDWRIDPVVDASVLLRASETATRLVQRLDELGVVKGAEVAEFPALAERSVGAAANLRVDEIEDILERDPRYRRPSPGWKARSDFKLPFIGAESLLEAGARVADHVERRMDVHCASDVVVAKVFVGHGGAFRHAAVHLGALEVSDVPGLSMYHCDPVCLERAETGWRRVAGAWKIRAVAERPD